MQPTLKQSQPQNFNDYVVGSPRAGKFFSSHERCLSSNSIYYQQGSLSRKKLTVVSRDTLRPDFKGGDYLLLENNISLASSNSRTKGQNSHHSPFRYNNQSSNNTSQNTIQQYQSMGNSRVTKSKLKRPLSPSPMTPSKIFKLKKSILKESNQQQVSTHRINQLSSADRSLSIPRFESHQTSPFKIHPQNSHRRMLSARNNVLATDQTNRQFPLPNIESLRNEMMSIFNIKVMQLQSKIQYQQESIKILQNKLNENNKKLREKEKLIQDLQLMRDRTKTTSNVPQISINGKQLSKIGNINDPYILKKMNDIETKYQIFIKEFNNISSVQQKIDMKLCHLQSQLLSFNSAKLNTIKKLLNQFIAKKSLTLTSLTESISYLDNKLIGRTQAIKQTLCELKQKVKQIEDTSTQKETNATKASTTLGLKESQDITSGKNINVRRFQNRLKQLISTQEFQAVKPVQTQGSLQFSLTQYDDNTNIKQSIKNVYYDYNQMSDISLENQPKDDISRLTDDFYYPGNSSRHTSRNISPINNKHQNNREQLYGKEGKKDKEELKIISEQNNFKKKLYTTPISSPENKTKTHLNFNNHQNQLSPASQTTVKIPHQTINKKIQSIQQLIDTKKQTICEEIQKGQLRCYVDKTGYLKYTDSRTFVFDKKGNLIPCTQGEFWFLVTKGLIYGKRDDEESRTVSFIQYDQ